MNPSCWLGSVVSLFEDLNEKGISYCHWKSNSHLELSLQGLTDLDILVDRGDGERFRLVLCQHNIKPVVPHAKNPFPGLEDYIGFDKDTGRQFHLHVHYQLVLGEQYVKGYRLPIERVLLDNVETYGGIVKIPSPDLELIVLALRALLKYRDRDAVKDMLSIRSPGLPAGIRDEFAYLFERTDLERVASALQSQFDFFPSDLVLQFLSTVTHAPREGRLFYRLRGRLRHALVPYQRQSRWQAGSAYFWVLLRRRLSFLPAYSPKKTPVAGGLMLALIGADGAGKSTVVDELCRWLSWKMSVYTYHLGSQERSRSSRAAHWAFRAARSAQLRWGHLVGEQRATTQMLDGLQRSLRHVYHLSTARDRYRRYEAGRRQSLQGSIVIYDRYPLEALHSVMEDRPMDGPRISVAAGGATGALTARMSKMEQEIYSAIRPPDHLFILQVSPQISQQRKPDHDLAAIVAKSRAIEEMDKRELQFTQIDADQPLEQVLLQLKTKLWDLL